jgi:phosphate/sulfate permease
MSFAHGANDVSNAIAPFAAIYGTYVSGSVEEKSTVPIWILAMGGFGIVCGLTLYGYRVRHAHTRSRRAGAGG